MQPDPDIPDEPFRLQHFILDHSYTIFGGFFELFQYHHRRRGDFWGFLVSVESKERGEGDEVYREEVDLVWR
jgi:hypothetical protein